MRCTVCCEDDRLCFYDDRLHFVWRWTSLWWRRSLS